MMSMENLLLGRTNDWRSLTARVVNGQKPIAFNSSTARQPMREAADIGFKAGCAVLHFRSTGVSYKYWFTSVAQIGVIGETFNLDALLDDYRHYYRSHPSAMEAVERELGSLSYRDISSFVAFGDLEADVPGIMDGKLHPAGEYARTGLLLGYPVQSTAKLVLDEIRRYPVYA
jgi:hypothetical protein